MWKNNAVCPDVDFPNKHEGKFACYNSIGKSQYDTIGYGACDTWCAAAAQSAQFGAIRRNYHPSTSHSQVRDVSGRRRARPLRLGAENMFAGGAHSDPPVCANDLCRDTAFPFKHPAVDVCYNAEGYEDYLKKGWSSCGTWCENTKGAGWQGL